MVHFQEYPNRAEQTDILHSIDLVESFDKTLMNTNTELVSHRLSYQENQPNYYY